MGNEIVEQKSNRQFKDTFFRALFHEERRALELCNAVENNDFPFGTPIKFYTRGDTSLTRRNNDLAYTVAEQLLYFTDHQGTLNQNMPLRFLPNAAEVLYTWLGDKKALYRNKLVTIPTLKFYVLYNGKDKIENDVLKLSDAFRFPDHSFSCELVVKVIDVNYESGSEVLRKSPSLDGYTYLVSQIRKYTDNGVSRDEAIKKAVEHCISKCILAEFLKENFKEVCGMLAWECTYDEELAIQKEEGIFESAIKLLKNGMAFQDVSRMLELSDWQIHELKERVR
jgi:hypothetical protein